MLDNCTDKFGACFSASTCSDGESSTAKCWIFITCQLALAALLFLTLCIMHKSKRGDDKKIIVSTGRHQFLSSITSQLSILTKSMIRGLQTKHSENGSILKPLSNTERSERNFLKNVTDASVHSPSLSKPEYVPCPHLNFFEHLKAKTFVTANDEYIQTRMISCASLALLSSATSSTLAMLFKYERSKKDCMEGLGLAYALSINEWIMGHAGPFAEAIDAFKFLPIFLILAYIAFLVNRWRDFMITCHTIQGRIQDVGVLIGSVPDNPVTEDEKKQIYKIYRFLNAIHIICYKSFMRDEFKNDDSVYSQLVLMNIFTEKEGTHFGSMGKKVREGLCSKILCEIDVLLSLSNKKYAESKSVVLHDKICDLRGLMARLHDTFIRDNPNEYILAMQVLVYCYMTLVVTGYPLLMFSDNSAGYSCVQPLAFFGTYFTLLSLQMPFILFQRLDNPFDAQDDINAENLVASTELALFNSMRSQFEGDDEEKVEGDDEKKDIAFASESTLDKTVLFQNEESFKSDIDLSIARDDSSIYVTRKPRSIFKR